MSTLDLKFMEMKNLHFPRSMKIKGFYLISRLVNPNVYLKLTWELLTTFVVYSPSVNNYLKDIILSIRKKWDTLTDIEQENVVAALMSLNKHGEIERALNSY